jgi:hypothetical protein
VVDYGLSGHLAGGLRAGHQPAGGLAQGCAEPKVVQRIEPIPNAKEKMLNSGILSVDKSILILQLTFGF